MLLTLLYTTTVASTSFDCFSVLFTWIQEEIVSLTSHFLVVSWDARILEKYCGTLSSEFKALNMDQGTVAAGQALELGAAKLIRGEKKKMLFAP